MEITPASARDEAALIRAAQRGDREAFEELVRAHDHSVLQLAMRTVRNADDARDVYQEAFLRVYKNLHSFRFDCTFRTWLYRIVTNLCLDHLRKRKVRSEEPAEVMAGDALVDRNEADPQRRLLSQEVGARIQEVLRGLTPRERTVFELRHYQGLRLKAIGEVLGTSEEAAKNCLFRVTQKMRTALGGFV